MVAAASDRVERVCAVVMVTAWAYRLDASLWRITALDSPLGRAREAGQRKPEDATAGDPRSTGFVAA